MGVFQEMCDSREPWADDAFFVLALLVAGRSAKMAQGKLEAFLARRTRWPTPRDLERPSRTVRRWVRAGIVDAQLRELRTGQYGRITRAFTYWAETGLDVSREDVSARTLEMVPGVGPKTARFWLLYRRPGVRVAALDRHVLAFLRECGVEKVPLGSPGAGEHYRRLEAEVLDRADALGLHPTELDNLIWQHFARGLLSDDYAAVMEALRLKGLATV